MDTESLAQRQPVWLALADFYLDTELQPDDFVRIQTIFAKSGHSIAQIRRINYDEVAPILIHNLMNMAGVWGGFNESWLLEKIIQRVERGKKSKPTALFTWLWRKQVDYFTNDYFDQIFLID